MSHYVEVRAQYRDQAALVEALEQLIGTGKVETHSTPAPIAGYAGRAGEPCHIIIRKSIETSTEGFGDVGFRRNADGTFTQFIDDLDQNRFARLPQMYARAATIRQARAAGYSFTEQKATDGTIRLTLSRWSDR